MKKILFVLVALIIVTPTISFAQDRNVHPGFRYDKRSWIDSSYKRSLPYPITVGMLGFVSLSNARSSVVGGGLALRTKINFKNWIGLSVDLLGDIGLGTFEFRPMVVFQNETLRGQSGFVPYFSVGAALGHLNGVVANLGFRYNTRTNVYFGPEVATTVGGSTVGYGFDGFIIDGKIAFEVGYRF